MSGNIKSDLQIVYFTCNFEGHVGERCLADTHFCMNMKKFRNTGESICDKCYHQVNQWHRIFKQWKRAS